MLEEVATTLEREVQSRTHWEGRANQAEQSLHRACQLQGIDVGSFQPQPMAQIQPPAQQYGSVANYGQQPPPPEGQPPYGQQQLMLPQQSYHQQQGPGSVASYRH